ncbi:MULTISPECIES: glycerophosphodiester phosphodiesterase [unclassified Leifsonia]|uniref:glycerophosphodiester phosphodiesterase n=1 Tax=unclassified Leifsonia TaxID=2663824 RepID=UPI0006F79514|nr:MULTISPECIES: glycerophosphodiester phosphodiesterase [unclassified Leifsonia]KQX06990.1 glycerophosphodiester phosphodiesterase [Leifsonia sp. Root1293]KRA11273.1 glycerophosphodiester phosphodiesterase [Leifsonia sp. Root60]
MQTPGSYLDTAWPRVLAHRGLAVSAPENTLLAFQRAFEVGATHLETDVHTSRDGVAIISHDPDLARLVGRRQRINELSAEQLLDIDLGHGQSFCTLEDALTTFPTARFNIDVKDAGSIASVASTVLAADAVGRVLITSFSERRRAAAVALLPGVVSSASASIVVRAILGARTGLRRNVVRSLAGLVALQIPERSGGIQLVTPRVIAAVHDAGLEVHVWTVNDPAAMRRLFALGVDGIVTDRADIAAHVLRRDGESGA